MLHASSSKDPQAGIPLAIWREFEFDKAGLSQNAKALMQMSAIELNDAIKKLELSNRQENKRLWICIALSHPGLTNEQLYELAKSLRLDGVVIYLTAIALRRESYFEFVLTKLPTLNSSAIGEGLKQSALYNNVESMKNLIAKANELNINLVTLFNQHGYAMLLHAAKYGQQDVFQYLMKESQKNAVTSQIIDSYIPAAIKQAVAFNQIGLLKFILESSKNEAQKATLIALINYAITSHDQELARYAVTIIKHNKISFDVNIVLDEFEKQIQTKGINLNNLNKLVSIASIIDLDVRRAFDPLHNSGLQLYIEALAKWERSDIKYLFEIAEAQGFKQEAIIHDSYERAYIELARRGEIGGLETINSLINGFPAVVATSADMMARVWINALINAVEDANPSVFEYLSRLRVNYFPTWDAVAISPELQLYSRFSQYVPERQSLLNQLMSSPVFFVRFTEFTEEGRSSSSEYINNFITYKMAELRQQSRDFISSEDSQLCFMMVKYLIQNQVNNKEDELRSLIAILGEKKMAHVDLDNSEPSSGNSLFQLALSTGNVLAARQLLLIPEVKKLAEENQYYKNKEYINEDIANNAKRVIKEAVECDEPLDKIQVLDKFDQFGLIKGDEIALVLESKVTSADNPVFLIKENQLDEFNKSLLDLAEAIPAGQSQKIGFIFMDEGETHANFGEVMIDKTIEPPTMRIFFCDPALTLYNYRDFFDYPFEGELKQRGFQIEVYKTDELLQKSGTGCTYFSLDGSILLSTQLKFGSVYDYMRDHASNVTEEDQIKIYKSVMPPRIKRSSQVYEDEDRILNYGRDIIDFQKNRKMYYLKGLKSTVLDKPEEKERVVKKSGQTAGQSIDESIKTALVEGQSKIRNARLDHKRATYKIKVGDLLEKLGLKTKGDLYEFVKKHKIEGFKAYSQEYKKQQKPTLR